MGHIIMDMVSVSSDAIAAIGYEPDTRKMRVRFTSGKSYDFFRVPAEVHAAFMKAYSKGAFYNDRIRGRYGR
jgi:hypothetical protein